MGRLRLAYGLVFLSASVVFIKMLHLFLSPVFYVTSS